MYVVVLLHMWCLLISIIRYIYSWQELFYAKNVLLTTYFTDARLNACAASYP